MFIRYLIVLSVDHDIGWHEPCDMWWHGVTLGWHCSDQWQWSHPRTMVATGVNTTISQEIFHSQTYSGTRIPKTSRLKRVLLNYLSTWSVMVTAVNIVCHWSGVTIDVAGPDPSWHKSWKCEYPGAALSQYPGAPLSQPPVLASVTSWKHFSRWRLLGKDLGRSSKIFGFDIWDFEQIIPLKRSGRDKFGCWSNVIFEEIQAGGYWGMRMKLQS